LDMRLRALPRIPFSEAAYARTGPESWGAPKSFSKNVRLSAGEVGGAVLLSCRANRRPDAANGLWLSSDPNSVGRGTGKGARSPNWARAGAGRTFSCSAIAAEGAGETGSRFNTSGKFRASETGVEPEKDRGSN